MLLEGNLIQMTPWFCRVKAHRIRVRTLHRKSHYKENNGQRVVEGQRAIQAASDVLLGWTRAVGVDSVAHDHYVRQLWDGKGSINLDTISSKQLTNLAKTRRKTLARSHARTEIDLLLPIFGEKRCSARLLSNSAKPTLIRTRQITSYS